MNNEELAQVESSQRQHHEVMRHQSDMAFHVKREEYNLFSMIKPKLYLDGDQWCCLYGENIQIGIVGFGESPYLAILDWNKQWVKNNITKQ